MQPEPWFDAEEIRGRVSRIQAELAAAGLDALLAFLPESVTWSTGFYTRGYSSFQFAIIPVDGDPVPPQQSAADTDQLMLLQVVGDADAPDLAKGLEATRIGRFWVEDRFIGDHRTFAEARSSTRTVHGLGGSPRISRWLARERVGLRRIRKSAGRAWSRT